MHIVRSVDDPQGAGVRVHRRQGRIGTDAGAAVRLDRHIDHRAGDARCNHFDRTHLLTSLWIRDALVVDEPRCLQHQESRLIYSQSRLSNIGLQCAVLG